MEPKRDSRFSSPPTPSSRDGRLVLCAMTSIHERGFLDFAASGARPALLGTEAEGELRDLFYSMLEVGAESSVARTEVVVHPTYGVVGYSVESAGGHRIVSWDMLIDVNHVSFQAEASLAERIVSRAESAGALEIQRISRPGMHQTKLVLAGLGFSLDASGDHFRRRRTTAA